MQFRTTYLFIENYNCNVRLPMYSLNLIQLILDLVSKFRLTEN